MGKTIKIEGFEGFLVDFLAIFPSAIMSTLTEPLLGKDFPPKPVSAYVPLLCAVFLTFIRLFIQSVPVDSSVLLILMSHFLGYVPIRNLGKDHRTRVLSKEFLLASILPILGISLLKPELQTSDIVEGTVLILWIWVYSGLFARWELPWGWSYVYVSAGLVGVITCDWVASRWITREALLGPEFSILFLLLWTQNKPLFRAFPTTKKPKISPKPGLEGKVKRDFRQVREVMEYLGTLEGGKVDIEDFLPALRDLWKEMPVYVSEALESLQGRLVTLEDMIQAGDAAYQRHTASTPPRYS